MSKQQINNERFYSGLTLEAFAQGMKENKDKFEENLAKASLTEQQIKRIASANRPLKVVVIAEDWCGDVLRYIPMLTRIVEAAPLWEVRVFYRDQNPDLIDRWLKDGTHRAIPVIAFFDNDWHEIGHYQERPAAVYIEEAAAREEFNAAHADLPDVAVPYGDMSQPTKDIYAAFTREFRAERLPAWHSYFVDEILGLLKKSGSAAHAA